MRSLAFLIPVLVLLPQHAAAQPAVVRAPFVVEQTYWIKPGKELQFISLFEKNRVPGLQAKVKEGRILWMRLSKPQFNSTNEQWDLRVTAAWVDAESAMDRIAPAKTQPDREGQRLALEQQIMDELILERTDVPVQEWTVRDSGP